MSEGLAGAKAKRSTGRAALMTCAYASVTVTTASLLTTLCWAYTQRAPFTLYYLAILFASIYGGTTAGVVSTVLSILVVDFFFLEPLNALALDSGSLVVAAFFAAGGGVSVFLVHRMHLSETELRDRDERLSGLIDSAMDAILMVDARLRIVLFNGAAEDMFGCLAADALNQPLERFLPDLSSANPDLRSYARREGGVGLPIGVLRALRGVRANQQEFPVEASISRIETPNTRLLTVILRDVSQRRTYELEIERLNRLYSARSHINQAIVRTSTRDELFREVCDVLVEQGRFRMAWLGWHDAERHLLAPVAQAGDEHGYLQDIQIHTDDRPEGRGPSGIAFREAQPYVCNDLLDDPATLLWRSDAERLGYRASAAFPIRLNGKVCGTLNVYADQPGYFQDKEVALLVQVAVDLSFALDNLELIGERRQVEAVAERERRFANNLIESMPGIFYLYNEQGQFLRWNRNFESVSGYSAAEVARMHPLDFFSGEDKPLLDQRIAEVFERGEANVEAQFVAKDGRAVPYFLTGKRISFDDATCLVGVGVDISERKLANDALRKSEERYRTTLDNILEGCQLIAFDWRYLYLNDAASIQNRRPNSELLGKRMPDVWPGIEASQVFALLRRCMEARIRLHEETEFVFPDGSKGWFDVRAQPVPEGIFVLSIDISERKQAELALRELNEGLERIVAERTLDLSAARERAEAADRIKSAFLATMSHELRTPLNSIIGFTGIILQGLAGPLNAEQSKQLGMVQGSARHLLELINDVLDISKIEAGQLEVRFAPFDVLASIEWLTASVKPALDKKGLTLQVNLPPRLDPLESDRRRVEQILLNLLNNAIKFTDRGGVTLSVALLNAAELPESGEGSALRIQVADTGIGMRPEDLCKLFQPFRQIDYGLERQHEGTGLGLAICHRLTGLLKGTIRVESTWGQGSVFSLTLPLQPRGMI